MDGERKEEGKRGMAENCRGERRTVGERGGGKEVVRKQKVEREEREDEERDGDEGEKKGSEMEREVVRAKRPSSHSQGYLLPQ